MKSSIQTGKYATRSRLYFGYMNQSSYNRNRARKFIFKRILLKKKDFKINTSKDLTIEKIFKK